jgi:hemolysin III
MIDEHGRPLRLVWNYDRAEIVLDGVVHVAGLTLGIVGAAVLIVFALRSPALGSLSVSIVYAAGLLAMLGFSAAYNLWPVSRVKWILRRFDHSAIYLLIAATYTPFAVQIKNGLVAYGLLAWVWSVAAVGILLKLMLPGRFDRLSILFYLLLSWSGVMLYEPIVAVLPPSTLWLLAAGGLLYTAGVAFHVWQSLRFQNAIWHTFVLGAAACHYTAVLDVLGMA